ncbi:MAG TPA: hypothetical protein PLD16_08240 [Fervidobacterium sp.]|nr:hypothetical protein [Fervidobacterium sp.]HPT59805.1 hypothetical protein [Fervidobacterium sp.]
MNRPKYASIPKEFNEPTLIIVEGKDDEQFIECIIKDVELQHYQIVKLEGKDNLTVNFMSSLTKVTGFNVVKNIAIILDADRSVENSFRKVRSILENLGFPTPTKPFEVIDGNKYRIGVFLFPDCENPGSIEDLIARSLNEKTCRCINEYIECMKKEQFKVARISKSILYSYLAIQDEPSRDLATAIKRNQVSIKDSAFEKIKDFLKKIAE